MSEYSSTPSANLRRRRGVILTMLLCGTSTLVIWTIYLSLRLPRVYVAEHWDLAWVGLDAAQCVILIATTWAAFKRRMVLAVLSIAAGTMMTIDAWFDVTTARSGDLQQSLLAALCVELPAAIVLYGVGWLVFRRMMSSGVRTAQGATLRDFWRAEIPFTDE